MSLCQQLTTAISNDGVSTSTANKVTAYLEESLRGGLRHMEGGIISVSWWRKERGLGARRRGRSVKARQWVLTEQ